MMDSKNKELTYDYSYLEKNKSIGTRFTKSKIVYYFNLNSVDKIINYYSNPSYKKIIENLLEDKMLINTNSQTKSYKTVDEEIKKYINIYRNTIIEEYIIDNIITYSKYEFKSKKHDLNNIEISNYYDDKKDTVDNYKNLINKSYRITNSYFKSYNSLDKLVTSISSVISMLSMVFGVMFAVAINTIGPIAFNVFCWTGIIQMIMCGQDCFNGEEYKLSDKYFDGYYEEVRKVKLALFYGYNYQPKFNNKNDKLSLINLLYIFILLLEVISAICSLIFCFVIEDVARWILIGSFCVRIIRFIISIFVIKYIKNK